MFRQYLIWFFVMLLAVGSFAEGELTNNSRENIEKTIPGTPQSIIQDKFSSLPEDNDMTISGDLVTVIPGSIAGVITNEYTDFIENVYVLVNNTIIDDYSNSAGEYFLEGVDAGQCDVYFALTGYRDTMVVGVTVISGQTTTLNLVMHDDTTNPVLVWYGNLDGSVIEMDLGDRLNVDTYLRTGSDIYLGNLFLSLGAEDQYIDSLLSQTEGEIYYPLTGWDVKEFQAVHGSPPNPAGWSSQAFLGWARVSAYSTAEWFHSETPILVMRFVLKAANDISNMGHIVHCLGRGVDPYQGPSNSGDTTGDYSYPVTEHYAPLYFPGDDITGTVTNQSAQPLENVYVEMLDFERDDYTNSSGVYLLNDLNPGYYDIRFSKAGCEDEVFYNVRVISGQTTTLNVTMQELGALTGVVTNPDLDFIVGALVTVQGTGLTDYTDANGEYFIDGLGVGNYTVTFSHAEYYNQTRYNVPITAGDTTQLDVTMPYLGAIDGVVKDFQDLPINNVHVVLNGQGMDDYTNPGGEFFFGMLNPGTYSITLTHADYNQKVVSSIVVTSGDTTEVEVIMELLGAVEGTVTKTDGTTLLGDVLVRILLNNIEVDSYMTTALGYYLFTHLQAGSYDIEASKEGYVTQLIEDIQIFYDQTVTQDILLVEDIGSIAGIVDDGAFPIESALVSVISEPFRGLTDIEGAYELTNMPSGYYDLKISKTGFEDAYFNNIQVLPEQVTTLNATLVEKPYDVAVSLFSNGFYRPSLDGFYDCQYRNEGSSVASNVTVTLVLPGDADYIASDPAGTYDNGTLTWALGELDPGLTGELWVDFNVPSGVSIGTMLEASCVITTDSPDNDLSDNSAWVGVKVVSGWNPFDKFASPPGYGTRKFIAEGHQLDYTVFFENETGGAATVTDITVTDTLDYDLDWSTLALGPVSHPLACSAHVDYATGVLTWTFTDVLLPDNITPPEGEGFVSYCARPFESLPDESEITNRAAVKFDLDDWELCPETGPLLRTIDKRTPYSEINNLPAQIIGDTVTINWNAGDYTGSGIDKVEIYVSEDSGPYNLEYMAESWESSYQFQGEFDKCYDFYSIAIDNVGNTEDIPMTADASVCFMLGYLYLKGDANMLNGEWPPRVIGSDVVYMINYFRMVTEACFLGYFYAAADINGDCNVLGSDVTRLVNYFRGQVPSISYCPDFRPAWMTPDDLPENAPLGWPPCNQPDTSGDTTWVPAPDAYAFVSDGYSGLQIIDIDQNSSIIGNCPLTGLSYDVFVQGDYAYVVDAYSNGGSFSIVDISDLENPVERSNIPVDDRAYGVFVRGGAFAFVVDGFGGFKVFNVWNAHSPFLYGQCDTPGSAAGVTVVGDYAYVADFNNTLEVIDISTLFNPVIVASEVAGGYARADVEIVDNLAYIAAYQSGLKIFDISNPLDPFLVSSYSAPSQIYDVVVVGNYAYATVTDLGVIMINVSDPEHPASAGQYNLPGEVRCITKSGDYLYVVNSTSLIVFGILGIGPELGLVTIIDTPGSAMDVFVVPKGRFKRK